MLTSVVLAALAAAAAAQPLWSCSTRAATIVVESDFSYSVAVRGAVWMEDGDYAFHGNATAANGNAGAWLSMRGGTLGAIGFAPRNGTDAVLGAFSALDVSWDTSTLGYTGVTTSFLCYPEADVLEFAQTYAAGVAQGAATYDGQQMAPFYNLNVSTAPVAEFPSWKLGPDAAVSSLGHVQWAGEFSFHWSNFGVSLAGYSSGQTGGPSVLHTPAWAPGGKPQAGLWGPLANPKSTIAAIVPDRVPPAGNWRWVHGPQGHLDTLPAGYSTRVALVVPSGQASSPLLAVYANDTGITAATYAYGAVLRALHNTTRFLPEADAGVAGLSYWTDNGQIYDGDYWGQAGVNGTGADVFRSLQAWFNQNDVPVASYQLDPYWFTAGSNNGNWTPAYQVFGADGFANITSGPNALRTTLYTFFWATSNVWPQFQFETSVKMNNFIGGPIARISAADSEAFHDILMARCKAWGCIGIETDFLDFNGLSFPSGLQVVGDFEGFMQGFSNAAVKAGVPIQLCMPLAADVLLSAQLPGVSNIRASDDNDLTYASADRWRIGLTSMLYGALDVRPFFDGTWTHPTYSGSSAVDVPYPAGYTQNATELGMAISTLSTGPVGIGDKLGYTNASLARMTCASNGVLLKPSLPASPVDVYFNYGASCGPSGGPAACLQQAGAELWAAPSFVPLQYTASATVDLNDVAASLLRAAPGSLERYGSAAFAGRQGRTFPTTTACPFASVLAVDVPAAANLTLLPADLTPSLSTAAGTPCGSSGLAAAIVAVPWSPGITGVAERCADGAPALNCVLSFTDAAGLVIATGAPPDRTAKGAAHDFEVLSLAPVLPNGYALLGELTKFTRVSPVRIGGVAGTAAPPSLTFTVNGAANEVVSMAVLVPGPEEGLPAAVIRTVAVQFGASGGSAVVTCTGVGVGAACAPSV